MPADERVKSGSENGPSTPGNFVFPIFLVVHKKPFGEKTLLPRQANMLKNNKICMY
jgi:hypothetical protein